MGCLVCNVWVEYLGSVCHNGSYTENKKKLSYMILTLNSTCGCPEQCLGTTTKSNLKLLLIFTFISIEKARTFFANNTYNFGAVSIFLLSSLEINELE